jgi:hypothetical protein
MLICLRWAGRYSVRFHSEVPHWLPNGIGSKHTGWCLGPAIPVPVRVSCSRVPSTRFDFRLSPLAGEGLCCFLFLIIATKEVFQHDPI